MFHRRVAHTDAAGNEEKTEARGMDVDASYRFRPMLPIQEMRKKQKQLDTYSSSHLTPGIIT